MVRLLVGGCTVVATSVHVAPSQATVTATRSAKLDANITTRFAATSYAIAEHETLKRTAGSIQLRPSVSSVLVPASTTTARPRTTSSALHASRLICESSWPTDSHDVPSHDH